MTESEEMYLVTIARLQERSDLPRVPLAELAGALSVQPVSANQMVRKLSDAGLLDYLPYKGVELTEAGARLAAQILRHRRLWEVFFVERLQISAGDAAALACRMEHLIPDAAAERLSAFLGDPQLAPDGKPIPAAGQSAPAPAGIPLNQLCAGESARVALVSADGPARSFLAAEGITPGAQVTLLAAASSGAVIVTAGSQTIHLTDPLAQRVLVTRAA